MVISQFNVKRIFSFKSENDAPVGPHRHGPESSQIAFHRVKAIVGQLERLRRRRLNFKTINSVDYI